MRLGRILVIAVDFAFDLIKISEVMESLVILVGAFQNFEVKLAVCGHNQLQYSKQQSSSQPARNNCAKLSSNDPLPNIFQDWLIPKDLQAKLTSCNPRNYLVVSSLQIRILVKSIECHQLFVQMNTNKANSSTKDKQELKADQSALIRSCAPSYTQGFIRVNSNEIWFSSLSPSTKQVLALSLRQCSRMHLMKKVFCQWKNESKPRSAGRMLHLTEEEGLKLIWRIQRCIDIERKTEKQKALSAEIHLLKCQYQTYQTSFIQIEEKEQELLDLKLSAAKDSQRSQLATKMKLFKEQISVKMLQLGKAIQLRSEQHSQIIDRQRYSLGSSQIGTILTKAIKKEVRNLLAETIIGIVELGHEIVPEGQIDQQEVYVIFEQSYQTKRLPKRVIVRLIGSEVYLEKVDNFSILMQRRSIMNDNQSKEFKSINQCHCCLKIDCQNIFWRCRTSIKSTQTDSYTTTDYLSYRKANLEGDYFYEPQQQHVLPYFIYQKSQQGTLSCNRAFCQECLALYLGNKCKVTCPYCSGICGCARCTKAYAIVRLIALDSQNDGNIAQSYHETLKLLGGQKHGSVTEVLPLRSLNNNCSELTFLVELWKRNQQQRKRAKMEIYITPRNLIKQTISKEITVVPRTWKLRSTNSQRKHS